MNTKIECPVKGLDVKAVKKVYFSWKPNTFVAEETGEEGKSLPFMPKMDASEWYAGIVASVLTKQCGENKVFIVSPEMSVPIECTMQFMPVMRRLDGDRPLLPEDSTQHEKIGALSPGKQEIWVNAFWPTNTISSFDSMETLGNRIDFVCKTQFNHSTQEVEFL